MGCFIEFTEPFTRFDFCRKKYKQQNWIDALLRYGSLDLEQLASVLNISTKTLYGVLDGKEFLNEAEAIELAKLFLILFAE